MHITKTKNISIDLHNSSINNLIFDESIRVDEFNKLRESVGWPKLSDKQATACIKNSSFLVSVRNSNDIVGMGRVLCDFGNTALISDVIVIPQYQGLGIGSRIISKLKEKIVQMLEKNEFITIFLFSENGKEQFYNKLGFKSAPNEICGAGMMKVEWKK